jgi:DNA-binding YbaB/EbfC family protein
MDMSQLMKQAQQMQQQMKKAQEELAEKTVEAESGGGMVKVELNGKQELVSIHIDPKALDAEEVDLLEDLILAAVQEGQRKVAQMSQESLGKITGGLGFPGLF